MRENLLALALNAGSTSLKFGLFAQRPTELLLGGEIDWASGDRQDAQLTLHRQYTDRIHTRVAVPDDQAAAGCAIKATLTFLGNGAKGRERIGAIGHRVVHGGAEYRGSVRVDAEVKAAIGRLTELAPLHNPPALQAILAAEQALPGVPQVAVFDTAFFAALPPERFLYALPYNWFTELGIRRFGFHGLSHAYCARRAAELLPVDPDQLRLIICHLGGGCSAAATRGGVAVASTMGFSPLEGLMMGTRPGSVDPGILLHLQRQGGLSLAELDYALNYSSGLLGVSGVSADLAKVERAAAQGHERARLAFELFADRVRLSIGALTTTLGGLDALVFTDRIGEQSPALRAAVCGRLEYLGVRLAPELNDRAEPDCDVAAAESRARILVLHTREELMIAREAWHVLAG